MGPAEHQHHLGANTAASGQVFLFPVLVLISLDNREATERCRHEISSTALRYFQLLFSSWTILCLAGRCNTHSSQCQISTWLNAPSVLFTEIFFLFINNMKILMPLEYLKLFHMTMFSSLKIRKYFFPGGSTGTVEDIAEGKIRPLGYRHCQHWKHS